MKKYYSQLQLKYIELNTCIQGHSHTSASNNEKQWPKYIENGAKYGNRNGRGTVSFSDAHTIPRAYRHVRRCFCKSRVPIIWKITLIVTTCISTVSTFKGNGQYRKTMTDLYQGIHLSMYNLSRWESNIQGDSQHS